MTDHELVAAIRWLVLLLVLLPLVIPMARSGRRALRTAAVWLLIGGFLFAFYRLAEWLGGAGG